MDSGTIQIKRRQQTKIAVAVVSIYLAAHAIVPVIWGDIYPFTSAPMFRDAPKQYCNYRVISLASGKELPAKDWLTFRTYDGNPVGYGVGIVPPPVLERFGEVLDEQTIVRHIQKQFENPVNQKVPGVVVEQIVIGPVEHPSSEKLVWVGVTNKHVFIVKNPKPIGD